MLKRFILAGAVAVTGFALTAAAATAEEEGRDDDPASVALSSQGDATKGKRVFFKCRACHNLTGDKRPKTGPNLDNLFGRVAGTAENFPRYSKVLKEAGFVWTEEKLDQWLVGPKTFLPGNKMAFAGVAKEQDRWDLMAYLREATVQQPPAQ